MAKIALVVLALVAVAAAKPLGGLGGAVVKNHHVTSSVVSPYLGYGLGYGMLGLGGLGGLGKVHTVSSHSVGHVLPHYGGLELMGLKGLYGLYPGGIGLGYGLI